MCEGKGLLGILLNKMESIWPTKLTNFFLAMYSELISEEVLWKCAVQWTKIAFLNLCYLQCTNLNYLSIIIYVIQYSAFFII